MASFNIEKLQFYINEYQKALPSFWEDEKYKWEAVQCFQKNWDIESEDFGQMLKTATRKHLNLLSSGNYFPLGMLQEFVAVDKERVRKMFRLLYDESRDVVERIATYQAEAEQMRLIAPEKWKNHYQDMRAISVLLWLRYPNKYYIYKYRELHKTLKDIDSDFSTKNSSKPVFYKSFLEFMNGLCSIISQTQGLKQMLKSLIDNNPDVFPDNDFHITTVDFVFYLGKRYIPVDMEAYPSEISNTNDSQGFTIKEQFRAYLSNCVKTNRSTDSSFIIGKTTVDSYVSFAEVDKLFDYAPEKWKSIASIYDITSSQSIMDIIEELSKDSAFKAKDSNETSQYFRSNAIKQYYCFLKARELFEDCEGKQIVSEKSNITSFLPRQIFNITSVIETILSTGLIYSPALIKRLAYSLMAKPFVILSGLAGSGKTQLALAFAKCLSENIEEQVCTVSIGADWTNREPLLGYPNALKENEYVEPESGVLQLLRRANEDPSKPYFLILDEMNLSVVERYFADFLSAMESGEKIKLWDNEAGNVPKEIELPKNLFIIGTINVDETTYMFSPKVLDRANVIEFKIAPEEMEQYLNEKKDIHLENAYSACADMAVDFVNKATSQFEIKNDEEKAVLLSFFKELKKVNAEFGYRTVNEICRYLHFAEGDLADDMAIDTAILQKLLPKLHGSAKKLKKVLEPMWQLCLKDGVAKDIDADFNATDFKYPESAEKIQRMYHAVVDNGFTSFAEA
ncbi:MAG: hypothetical protein IJ622_08150 [Bacteroidales bacterium]|nr:hypothetical protein [Bacteroidales bacterium]